MDPLEQYRLRRAAVAADYRRLGVPNVQCLCGETDPACFEREHIGRRSLNGEVFGRCCNCHRKITRYQLQVHPKVGLPPYGQFKRLGHALLGRYEYDLFNADFMLTTAEIMFRLDDQGVILKE